MIRANCQITRWVNRDEEKGKRRTYEVFLTELRGRNKQLKERMKKALEKEKTVTGGRGTGTAALHFLCTRSSRTS